MVKMLGKELHLVLKEEHRTDSHLIVFYLNSKQAQPGSDCMVKQDQVGQRDMTEKYFSCWFLYPLLKSNLPGLVLIDKKDVGFQLC